MSKESIPVKIDAALAVTLGVGYMAYGELPNVLEAQKRSKSGASALEASPGGVASSPSNTVPLGRSTRLSEKTASNTRTMGPDARRPRRRERTRSQPRFEL